ncbi:MAG: hypothetical protein ACM309_09355 [Bacillota bacterium]
MSTAPQGFQTPKSNWTPSDPVGTEDLNRIEANINAIEQGSRTLDPAQAPASNAGTLRQLLDWFANRIKAITGKTNWYDAPDTTLAAAKAHFDAAAPHNGHALSLHTHAGGDITSPVTSADKLDGYDANTGTSANTIPVRDANGKVPGSITGDAHTVDGKHASDFIPIAGGNPTGTINFDAVATARLVLPVGTDQYAT